MTSPNFSLELCNSERLRFMGLWFCFSDLIERKGNFDLSLLFCQKLWSRKEQEEFTLLVHSVCWKPATFCVFNFPGQGACTGFPKEVLKEPSKVHGDSSAREWKFCQCPNAHFSSILHQLVSNECKKLYFYHYWTQFGHHTVFI